MSTYHHEERLNNIAQYLTHQDRLWLQIQKVVQTPGKALSDAATLCAPPVPLRGNAGAPSPLLLFSLSSSPLLPTFPCLPSPSDCSFSASRLPLPCTLVCPSLPLRSVALARGSAGRRAVCCQHITQFKQHRVISNTAEQGYKLKYRRWCSHLERPYPMLLLHVQVWNMPKCQLSTPLLINQPNNSIGHWQGEMDSSRAPSNLVFS